MTSRLSIVLPLTLLLIGASATPGQKRVLTGQKSKPVTSVPVVRATFTAEREAAELEFLIALTRFLEDDDATAAKQGFLRVLELDPTYPQPMYNLAILAELQDDLPEAAKWFHEYLKLDRTSEHAKIAQARLRELENVESVADVGAENAEDYKSLLLRAQLLAEVGLLKEAVAELYQATQLDETRWEAYEQTAKVLALQGLIKEAKSFEQLAISRAAQTQKTAIEARVRGSIKEPDYAASSESGFKHFAAKDYAMAGEVFSKAWTLSPKKTEMGFAAAVAFAAANDVVAATMILNRLKMNANPAISEKAKRMLLKLVKK